MGICVVYDNPNGRLGHEDRFRNLDEAIGFARAKAVGGYVSTLMQTEIGDDGHLKVVHRQWYDHGEEMTLGRVG